MAKTLFDRLMAPRVVAVAPETAFVYMGLNALVFLPFEDYGADLKRILGADQCGKVESPAPNVPAFLFCRSSGRLILAFEGTRGIQAWLQYVKGAGVKSYGPFPGQCFAPFVDYVRRLQPELGQVYSAGDRVVFTGHSLGAACAGMLLSEQTRAGWRTDLSFLFACPRFGDAAYFAAARGRIVCMNLPQDPVPYLPPDIVNLVSREPNEIRWAQVLQHAAGAFPIWNADPGPAPTRLDWLVNLAGANIAPQFSPHQTYNYLRATWQMVGFNAAADTKEYAQMLKDLGLFDPWPVLPADAMPLEEATAADVDAMTRTAELGRQWVGPGKGD